MASDGRVVIDTRLDTDGAVKGMNGLSKSLKKVGALVVAAFSVKALVNFGKQAVSLASDLQEVQNVVDTAFGEMSYKMEEFANTAIETYGISKLTSKQTGSTFMAMAKGMDIIPETASDMAISLTGLSADMSSFYNVSQDVAKTALASIFTGETETLKKFGVVMTEVNLQQFAYQQGIKKSIKEMTQAEKVQLRYNFVMKQTALAQGDFAKTSDSWANQTRMLTERWKEFMTILGNGLVKVLTPVVKALNAMLEALIGVAEQVATLLGFSMESTGDAAGVMTESMEGYTDSIEEAAKAQDNLLGGYDDLNVISSDDSGSGSGAASSSGTISSPIVSDEATKDTSANVNALSGVLGKLKEYVLDTYPGIVVDVTKYLKQLVKTSKQIFNSWWKAIKTIFTTLVDKVLMPFVDTFVGQILPIMIQFGTLATETFGNLFTTISELVTVVWLGAIIPAFQLLGTIWSDMWASIGAIWQEYGTPIFNAINEAIQVTGQLFMTLWDSFLKPVVDKIIAVLGELWNNHLSPLFAQLGELFAVLFLRVTEFYNNFIAPIVKWLVEILGPIFSTVFGGILSTVGDIFGEIIDIFTGLISFITNIFKGDWGAVWQSVVDIFGNIWDLLVSIIKVPINLIIGIINVLIGAVEGVINLIIDGLNLLSFEIPSWVPGIGGSKFGFDLDKVNWGRIPYLASGAVLPANNPFLAVVGDQRRGTNIEAPLDTIVQAFKAVASEMGGSDGDIIVQIDGEEVFKAVRKQNEKFKNQTGGVSAFA